MLQERGQDGKTDDAILHLVALYEGAIPRTIAFNKIRYIYNFCPVI
jgi:hypothetical protein